MFSDYHHENASHKQPSKQSQLVPITYLGYAEKQIMQPKICASNDLKNFGNFNLCFFFSCLNNSFVTIMTRLFAEIKV